MLRRRHLIACAAALAATGPRAAPRARPLRMAYFETYSPFSFRDDSGVLHGLLPDVIDEVAARRLGVAVEHAGYPWLRAQLLVQAGEADAICTIATPARLAYAVAAQEPVVVVPRRIFVRTDSPLLAELQKVRDLAELRQLNPRVVSYAGNGWGQENLGGFRVEVGRDYDSALKMLVARRGDLMIDNALSMQFSLKRTTGGDAVAMMPALLDSSSFQLLMSKQSPHLPLLPAFDKALAQLKKTSAYSDIFAKYGIKT